jgi:branched-chain amino acid aminotransferase
MIKFKEILSMTMYYVDGEFVADNKAVIPVDDLAVLRGFGICDIMRTFHGQPYFLDEHIQRLVESGEKIGMGLPWTKNDIKQIVLQTLEKNPGIDEANIRIVITGGSSPDFLTPCGIPRLIVMVTPIKPLPREWYTNGVKVITLVQERPLAGAKVTAYIPAAMALNQAHESGAVEAIYVNRQNQALEGTTSNLFAFFNQTLLTPPANGILKGITRKLILSLAGNFFQVEEKPLALDRLLAADEVFITGTNKGVVPVIQIDDTIISNGKPGKNTEKLILALTQHTRNFSSEHAG